MGKLRGTRYKDQNSAVQSSQPSWTGHYKQCVKYDFKLTLVIFIVGLISEGKDRLEWYRQVDPAKLNTLKELIAAPDYKVIGDLKKFNKK